MAATIFYIIGLLLLVAVLLRIYLLLISSWLHRRDRREQHRLSLQLLQTRIDAANVHRKTEQQFAALSWQGYRKFEVRKKKYEDQQRMICSFELVPHDQKHLPPFKPGQFLTFKLQIPDQRSATTRCYSLSDCYRGEDHPYRVTVKRVASPLNQPDAPAGLASSYFHDQVKEGDILDVKAPGGKFVLDLARNVPIVLLAAGVGITPLLSMLNAIVESDSKRETWFFYGVRNRSEQIMRKHLDELGREHENMHVRVCYSHPSEDERQGDDYDYKGWVSVDVLKRDLPSNNYEFYVCGPPPMLKSVTTELKEWGVPNTCIKTEAFGPASIQKAKPTDGKRGSPSAPAVEITFSRSEKRIKWASQAANLLDFALENGIKIDYGCRAGSCGTCKVALRAGEVAYLQEPDALCEEGSCLTCLATPKGNLTLDA